MNATSFHSEVSRLLSTAAHASAEERRLKANALIEAYVADGGDLDAVATDLDRLANYVLADELSDNNKRYRQIPVYRDDQLARKQREGGVHASWEQDVAEDGSLRDESEAVIRMEEELEERRKAKRTKKRRERAERERTKTEVRVRQALTENPGSTTGEVARMLGLSRETIRLYRKRCQI